MTTYFLQCYRGSFFLTEIIRIAVFFQTVKNPIFKWNEHIKQHVKLKINNFIVLSFITSFVIPLHVFVNFHRKTHVNSPGKLCDLKIDFLGIILLFGSERLLQSL